jgi:hypothetical protein
MEMTSLEPAERTVVFYSSGTTAEKRSAHFHNQESLAIYEASLLPWFQAHVLGDVRLYVFSVAQTSKSAVSRVSKPADLAHFGRPVDLEIGDTAGLETRATGHACERAGESRLKMLFLTPPPEAAPHSSLAHMFECVRREFGGPGSSFTGRVDASGAWTLDLVRTRADLVQAAEANTPIALFGTAFNFVHLLDDLAAHPLPRMLPAGSRVMETGGYKGRSRAVPKAELHAMLARHLGVRADYIVSEYGMSELSSQAYDGAIRGAEPRVSDHGALRVFQFPPWARAQIISPESGREVEEGETGLIRVYDLANVRSVLSIQTEDLGIRHGTGFELIGRASLAEPRGCSLMMA